MNAEQNIGYSLFSFSRNSECVVQARICNMSKTLCKYLRIHEHQKIDLHFARAWWAQLDKKELIQSAQRKQNKIKPRTKSQTTA